MEVGESSLKRLVEGEKQFQVPLYQRQYAWEGPQLNQLWEDILEQYDLLAPGESQPRSTSEPTHFLGSLVLAPSLQMQAHGVSPFVVVDGQQRLTTLMLALCALRDHCSVDDPGAVERFNDRYLINKYGDHMTRYRLLPTQSDRPSFVACIDRGDVAAQSGNVVKAYAFFRSKLMLPGPDNEALDLGRLETVISQRLQFVAITASHSDNVHRIFESLNDRGVRLTQADLLRNYVFMLLPTRGEDVYRDVWVPMQNALNPSQMETLVFVDLIVRGQSSVRRPDIYRAQQLRLRPLEGNEEAVEAEVRELARRAKLFERIIKPHLEGDPEVRAGLIRLDRWGASVSYPLVLHLLDGREKGLWTSAEVAQVLSYLESFLVRRMIATVAPNNLNRALYGLIGQLSPDLPIADAVRTSLSETRKYWPSNQSLKFAIRSKPFYFQGRQDQKMLIFQRLEESFGHAEPIDWSAAKLSIEHVMPQTLNDEWRSELEEAGDNPVEVHTELLHTLGNLTVTAYNGQLSNNPFDRKKQILENSNLALNRAIAMAARWSRAEILARAEEIAEQACEIWPAPLPGIDEPPQELPWYRLDAALAALPYGSWTAFDDAAALVGSTSEAVAGRLKNNRAILNAHRVLNSDGSIPLASDAVPNPFSGSSPIALLRSEGLNVSDDAVADTSQRLRSNDLADLIGEIEDGNGPAMDKPHGWQQLRILRFLRHFYEAPNNRLHVDHAKAAAIQEGYDPRGTAGFYQGSASLRVEGSYRVLTDIGREWYLEHRHELDTLDV